jgi:hypothetical protein
LSLWLRVRGATLILIVTVATAATLAFPVSAMATTPSPAGATIAAACFLALAVPVAVGWGCARGDAQLESVSVRPVRSLDLLLTAVAVAGSAAVAVVMHETGVAPAGLVAARALLVYGGFMLLASPLGWRTATIAPTVYLLAVIVVGAGEDISHPAAWAWIAADDTARASWLLTAALVAGGTAAYLIVPRRATDAEARD